MTATNGDCYERQQSDYNIDRKPVCRGVGNETWLPLVGRVLLGLIFLWSGIGKISAYAGVTQHMASKGVAGALLPVVIIVEVAGAAMLIAGWQTRIAAFGLDDSP